MTKLQKYLLKLLKEVDEICVANHIDYYIFAGSMLGVERNEGILPWDDDVDLIMTKENYDRFSQVMKTNIPANRVFETTETNKEYPLQFGRYISTETSHITRSLAFGNNVAGIWLDIMYAVPLPKEERKIRKMKNWFSCYCELENESYIEHKNRENGFYWRYRLGKFLMKLFGKERVIRYLKKQFDRYPDEDCEAYLLHHALNTNFKTFDKKFFGKPVRKQFGDIQVNVSPYNRELCRDGYGDTWMLVPEEQERESHVTILDFDIPYTVYREDYMPLLKEDVVQRIVKETKTRRITSLHKEKRLFEEKNLLRGLMMAERMENEVRGQKIDLNGWMEKKEYEKIGSVFQPYIELQFSETFRLWNSYVPISEELMYPILVKLVYYDGCYYQADRILTLRSGSKYAKAETERFDSLKKMILLCRELSIAIWDQQDYERADEVVRKAAVIEKEENRICGDMEMGRLYVKLHNASGEKDYLEIKKNVECVMEQFPLRGECMKVLGDVELQRGRLREALKYYKYAEELVNNGLLLLDIDKKKRSLTYEGKNVAAAERDQ
ncbi:MAG: phosphorylcholine transferase LicD [Clostridia bacterium]